MRTCIVQEAAFWRLGMATVREVHDDLGKDNRYTTTLKTMQLMTEKGLLIRGERFGAHVYEASVRRSKRSGRSRATS